MDPTEIEEKYEKIKHLYEEDSKEYLEQLEAELSSHPKLKDVYYTLAENKEFTVQLEELIKKIDSISLVNLQSELIILIKKYLQNCFDDKKFSKIAEMEMIQYIRKFSMMILAKNKKLQKSFEENRDVDAAINTEDMDYEYMEGDSLKNFRKIVRNFIVYEMYKLISPRRLAGETKEQSMADNIMMYGAKRAAKFEGKDGLSKLDPELIKELEQKYKIFTQLNPKSLSKK
jgi:hypothetical protein